MAPEAIRPYPEQRYREASEHEVDHLHAHSCHAVVHGSMGIDRMLSKRCASADPPISGPSC